MPTFVQPRVHILGQSVMSKDLLMVYIKDIDPSIPDDYLDRYPTIPGSTGTALSDYIDLDGIIEVYGRLCYRSWEAGLNPNVARVRETTEDYIRNLIQVKHRSVFEHATINFVFSHVSRVFTHELVRHRVGVAISQESMRYMRVTDIPIWLPDLFPHLPEWQDEFRLDVKVILKLMETLQAKWVARLDLDNTRVGFSIKKKATSALRRFFTPTGIATEIGWTCNVSELRHVIEQRTAEDAELEMQVVFGEVRDIVAKRWPLLFGDMARPFPQDPYFVGKRSPV